MSYTIQPSGAVVRHADNAFIPQDPANRDYAEFLEWLAAGNTPVPYVAPVVALAGTKITRAAFIDRFGFENWSKLEFLADEPGTNTAARRRAAKIRTAREMMNATQGSVDLSLDKTITLVNLMAGFLHAAGEATTEECEALVARVLNTSTITAEERAP